ncbi:MAG: type II methionyl aminopeptidase [Euryarchaeota archaeon]|mgnify:FL=1|nr:type II methionyl aminopeptidase [Euryarchaeota archaeon]
MNEDALSALRKAGAIAGEAREIGASMIDEGVSLLEVAEEVESYIISKGAKPAFPVNLSINEVAAHYTPKSRDKLRFANGDVVKIDVGAHVDGYIGDTAMTVEVGTRNWNRLIESSARGLEVALEMIGEGVMLNVVGSAIDRTIRSNGHLPVVNLTGHSMKQYNLHAGISVPNHDDENEVRVPNNSVLAIEPFATDGGGEVKNAKAGNIYRVIRERELRHKAAAEHFQLLKENFGTLPFCERWATDLDPKAATHLRMLVRHGMVLSYPMLVEVAGGKVSQTEHTVIIRDSTVEITTDIS